MKAADDKFTGDMFGNRPGRPRKLNALTGAQRVAKHRARKAKAVEAISVTSNENETVICAWCAMPQGKHCGICMTGQHG